MMLNKRLYIIGFGIFVLLVVVIGFLAVNFKKNNQTGATVWFESRVEDKISFSYADAKSYVGGLGYDKTVKNVYLTLDYQKDPKPELPMVVRISEDHKILTTLEQDGSNYKIHILIDKNRWGNLKSDEKRKWLQIAFVQALLALKNPKAPQDAKNQEYLNKIFKSSGDGLWFSL